VSYLNKLKSLIFNLLSMTEEMMGYIKDFVGSKSIKEEFRNNILYIGQKCENENFEKVDGSLLMASQTVLDLLVGSRILEQPTGRTYKLTKERGEQLYKWLKGEEFKKGPERLPITDDGAATHHTGGGGRSEE
jgi:hypothetical protein